MTRNQTSPRNDCRLTMRVSVKRGRLAAWEPAMERQQIVSGHAIEVVAECSCRAAIDIRPDRRNPIGAIDWAEITFFPEGATRTRVKTAYYRAKKIRRPTEVTFIAKAHCRCADCDGVAEKSFVLLFDDTA